VERGGCLPFSWNNFVDLLDDSGRPGVRWVAHGAHLDEVAHLAGGRSVDAVVFEDVEDFIDGVGVQAGGDRPSAGDQPEEAHDLVSGEVAGLAVVPYLGTGAQDSTFGMTPNWY
jgi:hypothetical protein